MVPRGVRSLGLAISLATLACAPAAAPAPDAGERCVARASEPCAPCFARIGECCYSDATIGGAARAIAARCEGDPSCRACCDECAARTCEQILAADDCPAPP